MDEPEHRSGGAPGEAPTPRFVADAMLGRLATWLRVLGFDARYFRGEDRDLVAAARAEGRLLLTRDRGLLRRRDLPPHLFVRSDHVREQLVQVLAELRLPVQAPRPGRCLRCNAPLEPRPREEVEGRVPAYVYACQIEFRGCPRCRRIYWSGTHRQRMDEVVRGLAAAVELLEGEEA